MERNNFIDILDITDEKLSLPVFYDPKKNDEQESNTQFPWIYKIRSSVIYTEEFDPERRIRDAYCKSVKQETGTLLFHPYKKPYSSCIFKRFILEDPYDTQRALVKYCREKPLKFIIFGKPGVNVDSLGMKLAKYWKCIHINPDTIVKYGTLKFDKNIENKLRSGNFFKLKETWELIKDTINSPVSKRHGYVLSGLPLGYHSNAEFDIIEQLEYIFQTDSRPDMIVYITCPTVEVKMFNRQGFIEDLNTGYYYNVSHIKDGEKLLQSSLSNGRQKVKEMDYNDCLIKEYENYFANEKTGMTIKTNNLPQYSKDFLDIYIKKILPLIDSYIIEYDPQCVIKVDGRIPVTKMLDIIKEKMSTLPFFPVCQAEQLFKQKPDEKTETEFLDDRSEDSIEEEKDETYEEEIDDEEEDQTEERLEEEEDEAQELKEAEEEGDDGNREHKDSVDNFNIMDTKAALKRLKNRKPIHPNFKWRTSDFDIFCPVEFRRGNICKGIAKYTCSYLGNLYMMSSSKAMQEFLYDPIQYIVPPKPFPTLKIFVIGPPCSGKTTTVKLLSEFFQLKIISIKDLIEEITKKKINELEIEAFMKKIVKVKKLETLEESKFNEYEERRAKDIIDWITDQLPLILERVKYASMIEILTADSITQEEEKKSTKVDDDELEPKEELHKDLSQERAEEKLIVPKVSQLLQNIKNLSKTKELKQIISKKPYKVEFPTKSGMKPIFINPSDDPPTTLLKKISFETADTELNSLRKEFKIRGLNFYSNTEECHKILNDPTRLLEFIPNELRKPYYEIPIINFHDQRICKNNIEDVGIRTALGYILINMDELGDAFEKKILNIEAEMNMAHRKSDLRIGGWIVDDVPLDKAFWNILTEKFLLPDDIIFQRVTDFTIVTNNFCNIINFQNAQKISDKGILQEENKLHTTDKISEQSSDSLIDVEINKFLEVKNSFLKINNHYEAALLSSEQKLKKVCSEPSEKLKEDRFDLDEIIREDNEDEKRDFDEFIWPTAECLENSRKNDKIHNIKNPFDMDKHYVKPFNYNLYNDNLFLTNYFEKITKYRIIPVVSKNKEKNEQIKSGKYSSSIEGSIYVSITSTEKGIESNGFPKKRKSKKRHKDGEESISSSSPDEKEERLKKAPNLEPDSLQSDKIRASLSKKAKSKVKKTSLTDLTIQRKGKLFELSDRIIGETRKPIKRRYDLFEVFYKDIISSMEEASVKSELKYLAEIKKLLQENAGMKTIGKAMQKYSRKMESIVTTKSNDTTSISTLADISSIDQKMKPRKEKKLFNILSENQLRPPVRRTLSKIELDIKQLINERLTLSKNELDLSKMDLNSLICLQRSTDETQLSAISLPQIKTQKMNEEEKYNLKSLFDQKRKKDKGMDEEHKSQFSEEYGAHKETEEKNDVKNMVQEDGEKSLNDEIDMEDAISQETINLTSSEIICYKNSEKNVSNISSIIFNIEESPKDSENSITVERKSKMFRLPTLVTSDLTHSKDNCYCCNTDFKEEFCNCKSSDSDIIISRHKKRLCIWHQSSSELFPWISEREQRRGQEKLQEEMAEGINLKKPREKLKLPTILSSKIEFTEEEIPQENEKDILYHLDAQESPISIVYATSSNDVIKWRKRNDKWESLVQEESREKFDIDTVSSTSLEVKEELNSQLLLPNVTSIEWERFINFINSIYLSVSTLKEVGYLSISSMGSFYLECCPSGSETSIAEHQSSMGQHKRSSNQEDLYTKDELKEIAIEFVKKLYGNFSDDYFDHENMSNLEYGEDELCVLEVNLPLTESKFNTALNTALISLTRGKTISELFSADKHKPGGRKRLSSHELNIMEQDDAIKEIELENIAECSDYISAEFSLSNGTLIGDSKYEFIELFKGNLKRYRSLDERFRCDSEYETEVAVEEEEEEELNGKGFLDLYLSTVPRAILYIPSIVYEHRKITRTTRIRPTHLRRYYSLQSKCRLICDDSDENFLSFKYILKEPLLTEEKTIYNRKNEIADVYYMPDNFDANDEKRINENEDYQIVEEIEKDKGTENENIQTRRSIGKQKSINRNEQKVNGEPINDDGSDDGDKKTQQTRITKQTDIEEKDKKMIKSVRFAYPYDIIKLMFEKYEIINLELPDNEEDNVLDTALASISMPKNFERFLHALNYNVKVWLNEWEVFKNELLLDINCNLINNDFLPFYYNLKDNGNNIILDFLHNYELSPTVMKEELIKTVDLEKDNFETEEVTVPEEAHDENVLERDIGDIDIQELLPNQFSDMHPYCPVSFNDRNELVPASNSYKAEFRDEWYNFLSEEAMNKFITRAEKYIPLKNAEFTSQPLRICIIAPSDCNGVNLSRNISDFFGLPFLTLSTEIKRVKDVSVDLPVGIFDEDQENIKLFSLLEETQRTQIDYLENEQWDHFRNYYDLSTSLTDHEISAIIQPLWKPDLGFTFYSFPYSFNDLEYMTKEGMIPDVIIFIDVEKQRSKEREEFEQRIKTRQLLNFGSRLKKLLAADHLRFKCWKDVYPRLFNIVLRKFLKERRAQRDFKERLKLVKPTILSPEGSVTSETEDKDLQTWDVEWLLNQVNNGTQGKTFTQGLDPRRVEKYANIMDDPSIKPEIKKQLLEGLQSKLLIPESEIIETVKGTSSLEIELFVDGKKENISSTTNERMSDFPDLKVILDSATKESAEEEESSESSVLSNKDVNDLRQVAVTDFFEPTFPKQYLPKFTPVIYQSVRSFDEDDYRKNVTNASSSSSLGLDERDSIQSRELTSSLSLIDIETFNRQERLLHLIFGKQPPIKRYLNDTILKFKQLYPTPKNNVRNLKPVSLSHSTEKLGEYYKRERENTIKMQDLCNKQNIPYIKHISSSPFNNLLQNVKNVIRKPNALEKVYIINYKLAIELIQNGLYFISRFGFWCPVQIFERQNPVLGNIKEKILIPVIHKRYIYFVNGRNNVMKFSETPLKYIKQDNALSIFPIKMVIIGAYKSRKSLTAANLAKIYGLELITLEKVLNYTTEKLYWTELSKTIIKILKKGETLPSSYLVECIEAFVNGSPKALTYGWILDGFPLNNDDLEELKWHDLIPQVIFSVESNYDYTKGMFEKLNEDRIEIQKVVYLNNDYIDIINDEDEDVYYMKTKQITQELKDFDQKLIDFEITYMLPPVLIMETRIIEWLHSIATFDNLVDNAHSIWGNVHKVESNEDEHELLQSINDILLTYLWAQQDYNLNLMKGLPVSVYLLGVTEDEYQLHKSPFKECCPGCWYYNRIYFRCPTCKFKDMKPGLIQYENFFYWLCLQHYDAFLYNPVKFLMSYKTTFGKRYPEKANVGDQLIKENLDIMNDGLCVTCYYNNLPNILHRMGKSQHSVIIEKRKIYLFCSDECVCEMLTNPIRFLNLEIDYRKENELPPLQRLYPDLPPKGLFEKLVTESIYECIRKFLYIRPKIRGLSHKESSCTYLALNLKIKAKSITDRERDYFKSLLEYFENHCQENEIFCKNINQIIAFIGPLSLIEYSWTKSVPLEIQGQLLDNLLPP